MGCHCSDDHPRRRLALRQLARAQASGTLAAISDGGLAGAGLGSLDPNAWFPDRSDIDAETEAFDGRLNAWMLDYASAAGRLPAALIQQVDDFINRWRELRASLYFIGKVRANTILSMQGEWNRLRDQVASYGVTSVITPSMVIVDGKEVRADQIPAGSSTISRVETIAKWAAVLVAGVAVIKVSSDLGVFKKLGGLWPGARASNPRRRRRNPKKPRHLGDVVARSKARLAALRKRQKALNVALDRYERRGAHRGDAAPYSYERRQVLKARRRVDALIDEETNQRDMAVSIAEAKYDFEHRHRPIKKNNGRRRAA